MSSVNQFLELKCSSDVLKSVHPFLEPEKEITEAMAIVKRIKPILVPKPNVYNLFDLCAGNCLTSSLIAHLFKLKNVIAIDKAERIREGFSNIRSFKYIQKNIIDDYDEILTVIKNNNPSIIVAVHPCVELAQYAIKLYKESNSDHLIIMPCCEGKTKLSYPSFIKHKLSTYDLWCLDLCFLCDGNATIDKQCRSNKNIVITSSRKES